MKRQSPLLFIGQVLVLIGSGCGESHELGDTWTRPNDEMVMVYVPEGEFEMGSDDERYPEDQPVHMVALDGFWIERTEVTNAQHKRCVDAPTCSITPLAGIAIGFGCGELIKWCRPACGVILDPDHG